jgi:hypothetical protein
VCLSFGAPQVRPAVRPRPCARLKKGQSIGHSFHRRARHLAPAIRAVAEQERKLGVLAEAAEAVESAALRAVSMAHGYVEWVSKLGPADVARADAELASLRAEQKAFEARVAMWRGKLTAGPLAPGTTRSYERSVGDGEKKLAELAQRITALKDERERIEAVLNDPKGKLDEAKKAHADAQAALAALPPSTPFEPWRELFGRLASPPVIAPGLSSGEGLIYAIRDPKESRGNGDPDDPGVAEKRLFLNLPEFGSVLALIRRPGNTLSSVMRSGYECEPLATTAKVSPVSCERPYIVMSGSITPAELFGVMFDKNDLAATADNGFGNRPVYCYVSRDKLVAHPRLPDDCNALARDIAENVRAVYAALKPTNDFLSTPIEFTPDAADLYQREIYPSVNNLPAASENARRLFGRLATNLRKLAAILAVLNGESQISIGALRSAAAWIDYISDTVNVITSDITARRRMRAVQRDVEAIVKALKELNADWLAEVPQRDVLRKTHLKQKAFEAALAWLRARAPSPIVVSVENYTANNGATRQRTLLELRSELLR